jgi:hypothetical protein
MYSYEFMMYYVLHFSVEIIYVYGKSFIILCILATCAQ